MGRLSDRRRERELAHVCETQLLLCVPTASAANCDSVFPYGPQVAVYKTWHYYNPYSHVVHVKAAAVWSLFDYNCLPLTRVECNCSAALHGLPLSIVLRFAVRENPSLRPVSTRRDSSFAFSSLSLLLSTILQRDSSGIIISHRYIR